MHTNFKVIGLTRLGINPESTVLEADALTTRPSELLNLVCFLAIIDFGFVNSFLNKVSTVWFDGKPICS